MRILRLRIQFVAEVDTTDAYASGELRFEVPGQTEAYNGSPKESIREDLMGKPVLLWCGKTPYEAEQPLGVVVEALVPAVRRAIAALEETT